MQISELISFVCNLKKIKNKWFGKNESECSEIKNSKHKSHF